MVRSSNTLANRLRASARFDAIHGTSEERSVCGSQMLEAAAELDRLNAERARLAPVIEAAQALQFTRGQLAVLRRNEFSGVATLIEALTNALRAYDAGLLENEAQHGKE